MTHPTQYYRLQASCLFLRYLFLNIYLTSFMKLLKTYMNVHIHFIYTCFEYIKFILYVYMEIQLNKTFMMLHPSVCTIKQNYQVTNHAYTHTHKHHKMVKGAKHFFFFFAFCKFSS